MLDRDSFYEPDFIPQETLRSAYIGTITYKALNTAKSYTANYYSYIITAVLSQSSYHR